MDFIKIELTQQTNDMPLVYSGPGTIFQDENGLLNLKLYHSISSSEREIWGTMSPSILGTSKPGKLIKNESRFRLDATDMSGDVWTSNNASLLSGFSFPASGMVVKMALRNIIRSFARKNGAWDERHLLFMIIPGKHQIPCNEIESTPGGGSSLSICKMCINEIDIKIKKEDTYITVHASSNKKEIPEDYERRLLEALSIAVGRLIFPVCSYIQNEGEGSILKGATVISSKLPKYSGYMNTPIITHWVNVESLQNFIGKYLDQFKIANQDFFLYWCNINSAWQSRDAENTALVVSTSIEGIIKKYYDDYMETDCEILNQSSEAIPVIENLDIGNRIKKRILSSLNNIQRIDAKRILRKMSNDGLFPDKLVSKWISMRNKAAHAEKYFFDESSDKTQQNFDKLYSCIHIFNILLFRLIGYTGKYPNYSKEGWPLDTFLSEDAPASSEAGKKS